MRVFAIPALFVISVGVVRAEETAVSDAVRDPSGFLVHTVRSPYQSGKTKIRVLLPKHIDKARKHQLLILLPVEANDGSRYGNGLLQARRLNLPNRFSLICVAPTFSDLPWYADHPTDRKIRQETYLLKVVIPFVERTYAVSGKPADRLLAGFSKSGWGAFSLLLRHPKVFGKAAAWDAPLMKNKPNQFGMGPIFATQQNFEKYEITRLLKLRAESLGKKKRLILTGAANFRDHHLQTHALMQRLGIPHEYRGGPKRKHHWNGGWLTEAVKLLVSQ